MNRKKFLQTFLLSAGALFFSTNDIFGENFPKKDQKLSTEKINKRIVIIGSGYGGAVAALRLCERGHKVTMLEMGLNWHKSGEKFSPMKNPGHAAAWLRHKTIAPFMNIFPLRKFTGTLDRWDFPNIKIWMGRGVGGGFLVNGGMAVTPKKEYFKEIFPQLDADLFYDKYFPLANKELKTNIAKEEFLKNCDLYPLDHINFKSGEALLKKSNISGPFSA